MSRFLRRFINPAAYWCTVFPNSDCPRRLFFRKVSGLETLGVELECNAVVGRTVSLDELFEQGYDAIFLGVGAGLPAVFECAG